MPRLKKVILKQQTLFDVGTVAKLPPPPPGMKCKNCFNCYRHIYNSTMKYCNKQQDKKTAYGHKKVKANQPACFRFQSLKNIK